MSIFDLKETSKQDQIDFLCYVITYLSNRINKNKNKALKIKFADILKIKERKICYMDRYFDQNERDLILKLQIKDRI